MKTMSSKRVTIGPVQTNKRKLLKLMNIYLNFDLNFFDILIF